jgi:prophage regulatory protein
MSERTKRLIRRDERRAIVPLSDTRVWELERDGQFPKRIQLTPRCVAWDLDEILTWIEQRKAAESARSSPPDVHQRKTRPVRASSKRRATS